jgi:exodeoxyribonuclease V alpha subunit
VTELCGAVAKVIFQSGSFFVVVLVLDEMVEGKMSWTARGHLFGITRLMSGAPIHLWGDWTQHKKFGRQFKIHTWEPWFNHRPGFQIFFSNCIRGADSASVHAICMRYETKVIEALKTPATVLAEVSAGNRADLQATLLGWEQAIATCGLSHLLRGIPASDIEAAVQKFGSDAGSLLKDNPYRLMQLPGFSFVKADEFALSVGVSASDPRRVGGAVLWSLDHATRSGHLFLRPGDIPKVAADIPCEEPVLGNYSLALEALAEQGAVIVDGASRVYLPEYFEYERVSAKRIAELLSPATLAVDLSPFLVEFQRTTQLELSEAQKGVVQGLSKSRVLVITGLPGTGKSTSVRALVRLFEESRISFVLMAPTGIASKRLSRITGYPASTIHRALGYDGSVWKFDFHNRFVIDAVIVDEVSMVDQELIYRLLESLRPDTILVLVGDSAQLPSVGPGNVLKELAACDSLPRVNLTRIFRQSSEGGIVSNSHRINNGEMPELGDPKGDSEFKFVAMNDAKQIQNCIVRMAEKLKGRDENFQVLSAKYGGVVGVDALNAALRQVLNPPGAAEWRGEKQHFRVGDRLMVIKNDYKKGIYNGDVGKLLSIRENCLSVCIYGVDDDARVSFTDAEAEMSLRLAYAVTVHKSQGNEFDTIIMPIVSEQGGMLQRNLLYTAVTRARKQVWLLGQKSALQRAIDNNKVIHRNTVLGRAVSGVCQRQTTRGMTSDTRAERQDL